jgi:hypothetical protein
MNANGRSIWSFVCRYAFLLRTSENGLLFGKNVQRGNVRVTEVVKLLRGAGRLAAPTACRMSGCEAMIEEVRFAEDSPEPDSNLYGAFPVK